MKVSAHSAAAHPWNPQVCTYIAAAPAFAQPILTRLRDLVHQASPNIDEAVKWSRPFYLYRGVILGNMAAFTAHCSFGLWQPEVRALLPPKPAEDDRSSGSFGRLTTVRDLPPDKVLLGYLRKAVAFAESAASQTASSRPSRLAKPRVPKPQIVAPAEFLAALDARPDAKTNFARLSPSCRREYLEWIVEAKRPGTRDRRIATTLQQVAEAKPLHWKYA